jgi:hypothetical protein
MISDPSVRRRNAWFRVMLWSAPACLTVALFLIPIMGSGFLPLAYFWLLWKPLSFGGLLAACIYCGWLDGNFTSKVQSLEGEQRRKAIRRHALVLVAPLIIGVIAFGACLVLMR